MTDFIWTYGETSAVVVLLACVWAWKTRKSHKALGEHDQDEHSETDKTGEFR